MRDSCLGRIVGTYQKHMKLNKDDKYMIDVVVSTIISALHPKLVEPVWFYIIGPPSSGKTESVNPLEGYDFCIFISEVTENALSSGSEREDGTDPSMLPLFDGKVPVFKDLTDLISQNPRLITKFMGDMRDCYDGLHSKASGKRGLVTYRSRFGVIACATDYIDKFNEEHQQLGQRFLSLRINRVPLTFKERMEFNAHILKSMKDKDIWRAELRTVVQREIEALRLKIIREQSVPSVPATIAAQIMQIADLLALLRTSALDGTAVQSELGARAIQQLMNLAFAHAIADERDELDESDLILVRRAALDSLPIARRRMIHWMYNRGSQRLGVTLQQFMSKCKTTRRVVEDVIVQCIHGGIVEVTGAGESEEELLYRLTEQAYKALSFCGLMSGIHIPSKNN